MDGIVCLIIFLLDESMSFFQNWMSKQPDNYGHGEDCMAIDMNNGGLWDDLSCELNLPFVCVGEERKMIVKVKFTLKEDLPLNDLSVAILKQIKAKLIEKGLPPDVRLQWRKQTEWEGVALTKNDL